LYDKKQCFTQNGIKLRRVGPGRKPLPKARRALLSRHELRRIQPNILERRVKLGSLLDQWVKEKIIAVYIAIVWNENKSACETWCAMKMIAQTLYLNSRADYSQWMQKEYEPLNRRTNGVSDMKLLQIW
jgi:hypothetical protein